MAQRQEQMDRTARSRKASLEQTWEQARDFVLNYFPHEDEFRESVQGVRWGWKMGTDGAMLSVQDWFGNGARIDISKFYGVEHSSKNRILRGTTTQWTYWAGRQLSIVISYVGSGFLTKEQLWERIKERIRDPYIFNNIF